MIITTIDRGEWEPYTPDVLPPNAPANAIFCRRTSDGVDWYDYHRAPDCELGADTVKATVYEGVVQAVVTDATLLFPQNCRLIEIVGSTEAAPFAAYNGKLYDAATGALVEKPTPATPMPSLSRRQLLAGLLVDSFITDTEYLAACQNGAVPAAIMAVINQLPDVQQRVLEQGRWATMTEAYRDHQLTKLVQATRPDITDEQMDVLWRKWATL